MTTKVQWTDLREFAGVDLESSYVLSWSKEGETLLLDVDLQLKPEHAFYERPRPSQKACIRAALIEFPYCDSVRLGAIETSTQDLSLGRISGLDLVDDGEYELRGEFGTVLIRSERPLLRLKGH